jgi:hypothetical protein
VVPDNARVHIDARVGLGAIDAFGSTRNGYRRVLILDSNLESNAAGSRLIELKLRVGVGNIDVRRASSADDPFLTFPTSLPAVFPGVPIARLFGDGTTLFGDGSIDFGDGRRIEADGSFQIAIVEQHGDGSVRLDNGAEIRADGSVVTPGGFVIVHNGTPPLATPTPATVVPLPANAPTTVTEVQP